MNLSNHDFYTLFGAATVEEDKERYISKWISNSVFYSNLENPDTDSSELSFGLSNIWDIAHITTRDIRKHMGLTQAAFAERFCIPVRTVQNWEGQCRNVPRYVVLLLAEAAGILQVTRT